MSCSKDDDSTVKGCTDPQAVNYNINAIESDNSCQYSIVGDWVVVSYKLSNGTDIMASYSYILYQIYSNNTFYQEAADLDDNIIISLNGTYNISSNNTQITFDNGTDPFLATIVSIDSENVKLTGNINSLTATLELERI